MKTFFKKLVDRHIPNGSAARHVATLVSGTVLGQLVVVAASPILTRLYTPEDFGVLGAFAAVLGILGVVSGLRYELAIPLPKTIGSAANLLVLTLVCVIATSLVLLVFVFAFRSQIPLWLNSPAIANYVYLMPLGVLLTGIYQAFNYWAIRRKNFSTIARTSLQQGAGSAGSQVVLGLLNSGSLGLLGGQIIGQSAGIMALVTGAYRNDKKQIRRVRWSRIAQMARRYSRFPKFTTWQALLNVSSAMLPLILFATLLSPAIAGLYMLAHRTLSLPLSLIGRSIGQVFHSKAAEAYHQGTLDQLTLNTFRRLLQIGLGPLIFIGVLAPDIFTFVFGTDWKQAGIYAQWMVPWLTIQFVVSPLSVVSGVTGHQFGELVSQLCFVIIRIGALLVGALYTETNKAIEWFAISGLIVYSGFFLWTVNLLKLRANTIARATISAAPIAIIFTISAVATKMFVSHLI